ncbi:MAG TPA: serine hydrolase [Steroidobacteraceae bacterium]|nr:serine hydrolase [Steroidobacteraceae bacterium]
MKRFAPGVSIGVLGVVVLCMLIVARQPECWIRYVRALVQGPDVPLSFYQPLERVEGGNRPPAPRVAPALEMLNAGPLQEAADYAAKSDSKALIVTRHGHIVFERYWHGSDFNTLLDSQSFMRTLNAVLVGVAIDSRKIGWPDEPIGYLIPQWSHDPRGAITVRNLLQMSSGLAPAGAHAPFGTDIASEALQRKRVGTPGSSWADQPADTDLLAMALERATKERYAQYLSDALWRRLGAADAWLWLDRTGGMAHADCCLIARQGDWVRLGELLAEGGRFEGDEVVAPKWVAQMLVPAKGNSSYGSSLKLKAGKAAEAYALPDVFEVEGRGNRMWLVPSMSLVILRTGGTLPGDWDDSRIPNLIIRGARDYVPPPRPGDLRSLVPNH